MTTLATRALFDELVRESNVETSTWRAYLDVATDPRLAELDIPDDATYITCDMYGDTQFVRLPSGDYIAICDAYVGPIDNNEITDLFPDEFDVLHTIESHTTMRLREYLSY